MAISLVRRSLVAASLSLGSRVLRIALRAAILRKDNCRTTFERASHNGLLPRGLYAVLLTVPVFIGITFYKKAYTPRGVITLPLFKEGVCTARAVDFACKIRTMASKQQGFPL